MKFYIWGTGVIANEVWKHGVNGEFKGFVETRKRTEQYNGYPVHDIDEIIGEVFDYIIVANRFSDDIYAICCKKKISLDKVIFMIKGKHTIFNSSPDVRRMLGEENYTVYAGEYGETKGTFFEDDCEKYTELNTRKPSGYRRNTCALLFQRNMDSTADLMIIFGWICGQQNILFLIA